MRRLSLAVLTGLALALPNTASADWHSPRTPPPADETLPSLPTPEHGSVEPTTTTVPATPVGELPPIYSFQPHYRKLHEAEAQCLAVRNSSTANMLDKEREQMAAAHPPSKCCLSPGARSDRAWQLRRTILYYTAQDERNRSAGQALVLYFKAAELETQITLLKATRTELEATARKNNELSKQGFHMPIDPGSVQRQIIDTDADLTRAYAGLLDVNGRLKGLIGATDCKPDEWLWPEIEVPVTFEGVDVDAAVKLALKTRPELLLLRELNDNVDNQTMPVIREYLHGVSGLMAAAGGPTKHVVATLIALKALLGGGDGEKESRQAQISDLLAERERVVEAEVRRGVAELHAHARLVALSRERLVSAEKRCLDAERMAKRAGGSYLEVSSANLDLLKARNQLTVDVMAWHTARAKVREAQGVFVGECCGDR